MFSFNNFIFDLSLSTVLVVISLILFYITYYLLEVVKKPVLICGPGPFRELLECSVPVLEEHYWPPWWCVQAHLHTTVATLLRARLLPQLHYQRQVLRLSDGGQLALDWVKEEGEGSGGYRGAMVVVPGLAGDSRADYARCLAAAAKQLRLRCVVVNYRGLGGLPLTTSRMYSAVSEGDLREAVSAVKAATAGPVVAAGVSLGALLVARLLTGDSACPLRGALAVSPPLCVTGAADALDRGLANAALQRAMTRRLVSAVHTALRPQYPTSADWAALEKCRTVRAFDGAFTAPRAGFASADEYYAAATLRGRLRRAKAPLLCLCAADDPLQPAEALPIDDVTAPNSLAAIVVTARGGHIAFLEGWRAHRPAHDQYIARVAQQYFSAVLDNPHLLNQDSCEAP